MISTVGSIKPIYKSIGSSTETDDLTEICMGYLLAGLYFRVDDKTSISRIPKSGTAELST